MTRRLLVVLALLLTVAVGCGSATPVEEVRPLTNDEAARLAQTVYENYLAGGARFEANAAFVGGPAAETVTVVGIVDWENHRGRATVRSDRYPAITEVYWEETFLLERRPGVDQIVRSLGGPDTPWFARGPEPGVGLIDRVIAVVMGLAAEQPENSLLIQQKPGSSFVRADRLRGSSADVLRFGERNLYWLAAGSTRLLRFEANAASGTAPTVVDLLELGPVDVPIPAQAQVVPADAFPELVR